MISDSRFAADNSFHAPVCTGKAARCSWLTLILLSAALGCLAGCQGTTHHFLPPHSVESGKAMVTWTWHYDFNGLTVGIDPLPAVNVYMGVGDSATVGAGFQFLGISHLSFAKYYPDGDGGERLWFAHLNQPLGRIYDNPYLELGGGLVHEMSEGTDGMVMAGLAYGTGVSYPIAPAAPRERGEREAMGRFAHKRRLIPFLKGSLQGRAAGIALSWYVGQSRTARENILNGVTKYNDTLLVILNNEVDSIVNPPVITFDSYYYIYIYLKGGEVVYVGHALWEYVDPNQLTTWRMLLNRMPREDEDGYYYDYCFVNGKEAILSVRKLKDTWKAGKDIVITRFPPQAVRWMQPGTTLWNDLSVGLGIFDYPDK